MDYIVVPTRKVLLSWRLPQLDKLYWKLFSRWVRLKNADPVTGMVKCFICGHKAHWKNVDCSHYVKRANACTRYSLLNNNPCCVKCNRLLEGNLKRYALRLDAVYGRGTAEKLEYLGRQTCKVDRGDYIDGIEDVAKRLANYG